jgi:hypothetical protein
VQFCQDGMPVVSLAVAAVARDVTVRDGHVEFPKPGGGEFFGIGIPMHVGSSPISAERATEYVFSKTGLRVIAVPDLVTPIIEQGFKAPQLSLWRLVLESPVTLRRISSGITTSAVVYVGQATPEGPMTLFVPKIAQLTGQTVPYLKSSGNIDERGETLYFTILRLPDVPGAFEAASPTAGEVVQ